MKPKVFCTFCDDKNVSSIVHNIRELTDCGKIFLYGETNKPDRNILTYTVYDSRFDRLSLSNNTIPIHIKRSTNTFYTLNSLNLIISEENGGRFVNGYEIDWELYRNCLISTTSIGYKVTELTYKKFFN